MHEGDINARAPLIRHRQRPGRRTGNACPCPDQAGGTVYSDSGQAIGTISNLLIRSQGDVSGVVISVGGFLGIDNKLVELSFNQLKFEPSANSTTDRNETTVSGTSTPISRVSRAESEHPVADAAVSKSAYSVVLLGATKAMLTKMPAFTYHQQS
jgi:hypothetical protein